MSRGGKCAHINTGRCVQGEAEQKKVMKGRGIQLTGTSFQYHLEGDYPDCRDQRGRGREGRKGGGGRRRTDEGQGQK